MKILHLFLFSIMAMVSVHAVARQSIPVLNLESPVGLNAAGVAPTQEQVRLAIIQAAAGREWVLQETAPGVFIATINVRNKHQATTEIRYSAQKYSFTLLRTVNLNQELDKDATTVLIHPNYNKWIQFLSDDIRVALLRP